MPECYRRRLRLASLIPWGVHLAAVVIQLIDLHIDQMVTRHCADIFPDGHFDSSVLMRHKARVRGLWLACIRLVGAAHSVQRRRGLTDAAVSWGVGPLEGGVKFGRREIDRTLPTYPPGSLWLSAC